MNNLLDGWSFEPPIDFEIGKTYIVRGHHDNGYWADFLITVTEKTGQGDYGFTIDTVLDGSNGLLDGYLEAGKK